MSNDDTNLENTLAMCKRFGFNAEITNEIVWNTAYKLGRSRWRNVMHLGSRRWNLGYPA